MELFSIVCLIIIALLAITLGKLLVHSLRFIFYSLLIVLFLIFAFGISLNDIISLAAALLTRVLNYI